MKNQSSEINQDNIDIDKIRTKNKTGAMVMAISEISKQFINEACCFSENEMVVDVGCCYGVATLPIIEKGQCQLLGIDLAKEHLSVLAESIQPKHQMRFTGIAGKFPDVFNLPPNSIMAFHAAHLLQFLKGEEITIGLQKAYDALKPGGKIYLSTTSIYLPWLTSFIPLFKNNEAKGMQWPGEIFNFNDYAPEEAKNVIQDFFHVLTKHQLVSLLEEIGFTIETSFCYDVDSPQSTAADKKEMIGVVAIKKN
jgi:SAM-dependent methyltransferase